MTARFERLSTVDHLLLVGLLSLVALVNFPATADAQFANKTDVFEIKNLPQLTIQKSLSIPTPEGLNIIVFNSSANSQLQTPQQPSTSETAVQAPVTTKTQVAAIKTAAKPAVAKTAKATYKSVPPKSQNKAYMHEPEIRNYLCPKLGDKCNTFIAILKAENGTHECTRDNRGTNRNGSIDVGLAQINWTPHSPYSFEQLQDCKFNLDIAMKKYETRGFQPWAAYNSGKYKRHLTAVTASAIKQTELAVIETK